ncbi:MAG: DUF4097 family beta strand repeat protein [Euzebyales bacterium]|nr:DUF4097 family beta strand repeat protein [Euzebyales bacterium]
MTSRRETFTVSERPAIEVRMASGGVRVLPGRDGQLEVEIDGGDPGGFQVSQSGDRVVVSQPSGARRWASHDITVTAPEGVAVEARLASADLDVNVNAVTVRVEVASGDVRAGKVTGDVRVRTASGDLVVEDVGGNLEVSSASGDVRARRVDGSVNVNTASGGLSVEAVGGSFSAKSASGDLVVRAYAGTDLRAATMSGDVRVGFPAGRTLDLDLTTLSGDVRNGFAMSSDAAGGSAPTDRTRVRARTVSGDIVVGPV